MGIESIEIAWQLEERYHIRFARLLLHDAETVADLEELVLRLRAEQLAPHELARVTPAMVRQEVRATIADVLPIDAWRVLPESRLMHDLGIDM